MFDAKAMADEVIQKVREFVAKAVTPVAERLGQLEAKVEAIPAPEPGQKGEDGKDGIDGTDGKSVTVDDVMPELRSYAEGLVKAIPLPKDGASVTMEDVTPLLRCMADTFFASLPVPKDGKGVSIDDLRPYFEAEQAKWALDFERRAQDVLQRAIDAAPKAKDGIDGFNLDDFDVELKEDGRTLVLRFARGELVKERELRLPIMLDAGVYRDDREYAKGDSTSFGGSIFIAQSDNPGKPESGDGWRLAVKRGRDGKDAVPAPKQQGPVRLA